MRPPLTLGLYSGAGLRDSAWRDMFSLFTRRTAALIILLAMMMAIAAGAITGAAADPAAEMSDFSRWTAQNATVTPFQAAGPGIQPSLRIDFPAPLADNGMRLATVVAPTPWDLTGKCLLFHFTDLSTDDIALSVAVSDNGALWPSGRSAVVDIGAGQTVAVTMSLGPESPIRYHFNPPLVPDALPIGAGAQSIDMSHITAIQIGVQLAPSPVSVVVGPIETPTVDYSATGIIDQYGQFSRLKWFGKISSQHDFDQQREAEARELHANPGPPDWDRYGGWDFGPKLTATGFFRTQKVNGKWWLVDPDGHLFFSMGLNCVTTDSPTLVGAGRAPLFAWLPKPGDPLSSHAGHTHMTVEQNPVDGPDFNFYGANVERKYGQDYLDKWRDVTFRRMRSWGFNTVGSWSPQAAPSSRVPYVVTVYPEGPHARLKNIGSWVPMHDPFDPQFAVDVKNCVEAAAAGVRNDPMCLGYFVDNELYWGWGDQPFRRLDLPVSILGLDNGSPAKRALLAYLQSKYPTIQDLDSAWTAKYTSWDSITSPRGPWVPGNTFENDLSAMLRLFAEQYFRTVQSAVRAADPNHLYLGCRFSSWRYDVTDVAAKYCDVISFTDYDRTVEHKEFDFLSRYDKPCLIDEYSFGSSGGYGYTYGFVYAADQKDRGARYAAYIDSMLTFPEFIGAHWFQYVDQPLTGRSMDGEAANCGFVTQTDTPYPELVSAARAENAGIYAKRYGEH